MKMHFKHLLVVSFALIFAAAAVAQQRAPSNQPTADTLRVAVDLVLLDVGVTDRSGRFVKDLPKEAFKVFEDKVEQPVTFFSSEEAPVTWGLVVDRSGSMADMKSVYEAAVHMINDGTAQDEMFLLTFSRKIDTIADLTLDRRIIKNSIFGLRADGSTALWDAINSGIDYVKRGTHRKKALLVITDGLDNKSVLTYKRILDRVRESDLTIYTVGINTPSGPFAKGSAARDQLRELAEITGGYAHFPTDIEKCRETMAEITREVGEQYTIGYYPVNGNYDGKWRKIRVVAAQQGSPTKYIVRSRAGYYAMQSQK